MWIFANSLAGIVIAVIIAMMEEKCRHQYKIIKEMDVYDGGELPVQTKYVLRCEKCGKIKTKKV